MTKFRLSAAALGLSFAAFAAVPALAITSAAECEYEGGETFNVGSDVVCIVQIRPEEYRTEVYDGQQLGVSECTGTELNDGLFCKVTLVKGPKETVTDGAKVEPVSTDDMSETEKTN